MTELDAVTAMLTRSCDECDKTMDMRRAVWWCEGGICCSEGCARQFTKDAR